MTSVEIDNLVSIATPASTIDAVRGPCSISIPRLEICTRTSFAGALRYFRVPTVGLKGVTGDVPMQAGEFVQFAKFSLAECGRDETPLLEKDQEDEVPAAADAKKLVFDRPFVFFVYHSETTTILVAGQFTGMEANLVREHERR